MKTIKTFAAAALLSSSFMAPISSANAAVTLLDSVTPAAADGTTLAAMQSQCDTLAAAHDTGNGDIWTAEVVLGDVTQVGTTTETGTHSINDATGDVDGAGTFTPAHREIEGDPYRNGGSVNMFGNQIAVGGHYSASAYDFLGEFASTFAHAFSCDIYQSVYHAATTEHHNAEGVYVVYGDFGDSEDAIRGNCEAFTAAGLEDPQPDWFGDEFHGGNVDPTSNGFGPHCQFQGTQAYDEDIPESWDQAAFVVNEAGIAVNQDQTDTLAAHEDFGEGFDTSETLNIGKVVVCISPKKLPGTWTKQNGYTGSLCTTSWYNSGAMTGVSNLNTGSHNYVTVPVI